MWGRQKESPASSSKRAPRIEEAEELVAQRSDVPPGRKMGGIVRSGGCHHRLQSNAPPGLEAKGSQDGPGKATSKPANSDGPTYGDGSFGAQSLRIPSAVVQAQTAAPWESTRCWRWWEKLTPRPAICGTSVPRMRRRKRFTVPHAGRIYEQLPSSRLSTQTQRRLKPGLRTASLPTP
jgi:hypothetical protein